MARYPNLFKDLGKLDDDYSIQCLNGSMSCLNGCMSCCHSTFKTCEREIGQNGQARCDQSSERANCLVCRQHSGAKE